MIDGILFWLVVGVIIQTYRVWMWRRKYDAAVRQHYVSEIKHEKTLQNIATEIHSQHKSLLMVGGRTIEIPGRDEWPDEIV